MANHWDSKIRHKLERHPDARGVKPSSSKKQPDSTQGVFFQQHNIRALYESSVFRDKLVTYSCQPSLEGLIKPVIEKLDYIFKNVVGNARAVSQEDYDRIQTLELVPDNTITFDGLNYYYLDEDTWHYIFGEFLSAELSDRSTLINVGETKQVSAEYVRFINNVLLKLRDESFVKSKIARRQEAIKNKLQQEAYAHFYDKDSLEFVFLLVKHYLGDFTTAGYDDNQFNPKTVPLRLIITQAFRVTLEMEAKSSLAREQKFQIKLISFLDRLGTMIDHLVDSLNISPRLNYLLRSEDFTNPSFIADLHLLLAFENLDTDKLLKHSFLSDKEYELFKGPELTAKQFKFVVSYTISKLYRKYNLILLNPTERKKLKAEHSLEAFKQAYKLMGDVIGDREGTLEKYLMRTRLRLAGVVFKVLSEEKDFLTVSQIVDIESKTGEVVKVDKPLRAVIYDSKGLPSKHASLILRISADYALYILDEKKLSRPYLIDANLNPPSHLSDKHVHLMNHYAMECQNNKHQSLHGTVVWKTPKNFTSSSSYCIDYQFLFNILDMICLAGHGDNQLLLSSMFDVDPTNWKHIETQLGYSRTTPSGHDLLQYIIIYGFLFYAEGTGVSVQDIKKTIAEIKDKSEKRFYLKRFNMIEGKRYAIKDMLQNASLYIFFELFKCATFIDTRGRLYQRGLGLNVQGLPVIKSILRFSNLREKHLADTNEIARTAQALKDHAAADSLSRESPEEYKAWLKRLDESIQPYINPAASQADITRKEMELYATQLKTYITLPLGEDYMEIVDKDVARKLSYEEYLPIAKEFILATCTKKNKMILALSLHLYIYERLSSPLSPNHKFMYELDATISGIQMMAIFLGSESLAIASHLKYGRHPYFANDPIAQFESSLHRYNENDLYKLASEMFVSDLRLIMATYWDVVLYETPNINEEVTERISWIVVNRKQLKSIKEKYKNRQYFWAYILNHIQIDKDISLLEFIYRILMDSKVVEVILKRETSKKDIMTYMYNSTTQGRIQNKIEYFETHLAGVMDHKDIKALATLMERFFYHKFRHLILGDAQKLKEMSREIGKHVRNTNENISVINKYLTYTITSIKRKTIKMDFTSTRSAGSRTQLNIRVPIYDKKSKRPKMDANKVKQSFGPNFTHSMDAFIVHTINEIVYWTNHRVQRTTLLNSSTHDTYCSNRPVLTRPIIEWAYLKLNKAKYHETLKHNNPKLYKKLLEIIQRPNIPFNMYTDNPKPNQKLLKKTQQPHRTFNNLDLTVFDPAFIK